MHELSGQRQADLAQANYRHVVLRQSCSFYTVVSCQLSVVSRRLTTSYR
jgi:hypothetical protein